MKKFAKTLALVLALCMVMSVSAFASTAQLTQDNYVIDITVTGATDDEQVAVLVVEAGEEISSDSIVYVGQAAAVGGTATFNTVSIANTVSYVDVYAGNATYARDHEGFEEVMPNLKLTNEVTSVTVAMSDLLIIDDPNEVMENGETTMRLYGSAVSAKFAFTLPTDGNDVEEAYMIWSLRYTNEEGADDVMYTRSINITDNLEGLSGPVRLSVAFANGTKDDPEEPLVEITNASALFKFVREQHADGEYDQFFIDEEFDEDNEL